MNLLISPQLTSFQSSFFNGVTRLPTLATFSLACDCCSPQACLFWTTQCRQELIHSRVCRVCMKFQQARLSGAWDPGLLLDGRKWKEKCSFCGQTVILRGLSSLLCPGSPFSTQDQGGNLVGAIFLGTTSQVAYEEQDILGTPCFWIWMLSLKNTQPFLEINSSY